MMEIFANNGEQIMTSPYENGLNIESVKAFCQGGGEFFGLLFRLTVVLTMCILCIWITETRIMVKTLTKHGNSYAIVIDKPILDLLQAGPDTPFEIVSDGRSLVLTPVRDPEDEKKFDDAVAMIHKRFGRAMKKLAE
jgi:antitoxin component of MazEF toxin-antitoxin module